MLFVERGVWCFKITGQFIKRGQVKQNFFIFFDRFLFTSYDITHDIFCVLLLLE